MPTRTEEVASKAVGAMKAAKATVEGLSGVFKQLTREHGEVSAMLLRVKTSSSVDIRRDLFPTIRAELLSHEKCELREVYPAFRLRPELESIAADHDCEARELEQILDELTATPYEAEPWELRFNELVELVNHHTKEEENDYFPKANRVLGKEEAELLEGRYLKAKAEVMAQETMPKTS